MTRGSLDRIDRKIIYELMRDATIPIADLAGRVNLSQTPCWKRVRKLEAAGIITGRVATVDPQSIGLSLIVFVEVEAFDHSPEWRASLAQAVEAFPQIVEAHRIAGDVDYLLKVAVPDMSAFDDFYAELTSTLRCRNVTSKFSMESIKARTAWPIDTDAVE